MEKSCERCARSCMNFMPKALLIIHVIVWPEHDYTPIRKCLVLFMFPYLEYGFRYVGIFIDSVIVMYSDIFRYIHNMIFTYSSRCICGSGANASVLHYGHAGAPNKKQLQDGDMFLNDMGCSLHGYASDITCSYPVNGRFTSDQRLVYEGVLAAHDGVIAQMKSGVDMKDLHVLSHEILCSYFLERKFFHSASVAELLALDISTYFYPHGLGHMMGLDVHDCGRWMMIHVNVFHEYILNI